MICSTACSCSPAAYYCLGKYHPEPFTFRPARNTFISWIHKIQQAPNRGAVIVFPEMTQLEMRTKHLVCVCVCVCVCVGGGCEGTAGRQRQSVQALPELSKHQPGKRVESFQLRCVQGLCFGRVSLVLTISLPPPHPWC